MRQEGYLKGRISTLLKEGVAQFFEVAPDDSQGEADDEGWLCTCGRRNAEMFAACRSCDAARPPTQHGTALSTLVVLGSPICNQWSHPSLQHVLFLLGVSCSFGPGPGRLTPAKPSIEASISRPHAVPAADFRPSACVSANVICSVRGPRVVRSDAHGRHEHIAPELLAGRSNCIDLWARVQRANVDVPRLGNLRLRLGDKVPLPTPRRRN